MKITLGTNAIRSFLVAIFQNLKVDANNDGTVSTAEWTAVAFSVLPQFLNINLLKEAKDLTRPEARELVEWAKIQFPELSQLDEKVEGVVVATLDLILAAENLFNAVQVLSAPDAPVVAGEEAAGASDKIFVEKKSK